MKHLTSIENIKSATRFVGNNVDNSKIETYIDESEQINIKPIIGDALFIDLLEYVRSEDKRNLTDYSTLLNGGIYQSDNGKQIFKGLTETLNYYVWARIVKNINYTVTRFGVVNKNDQYSSNAELKERLALEKDALTIADKYLSDCIKYISENKDKFPLFKQGKKRSRLNITIIGD